MVDVIGLVLDPRAFFKTAVSHLKEGGALYVSTPVMSSMAARLLGPAWWELRGPVLHYFSSDRLKALIEESGLKIEHSGPVGRMFPARRWNQTLLGGSQAGRWFGKIAEAAGVAERMYHLDLKDRVEVVAIK